jgi:hypothetical protein
LVLHYAYDTNYVTCSRETGTVSETEQNFTFRFSVSAGSTCLYISCMSKKEGSYRHSVHLSNRIRPNPPPCHISYMSDTIREDTCTERVLFTRHVSSTCLTLTLSVSCTKKYSGSCFLMQVVVVRCFGVQLTIILPS